MLLFCNTKQFEGVGQQSSLVITVVLFKTPRAKAVEARRAAMMLWA
jgi:hypothetical protein